MSVTAERTSAAGPAPDGTPPTSTGTRLPLRQGKAVNRRGRVTDPAPAPGQPRTAPGEPRTTSGPPRGARARVRYAFDTGLSRGPSVVIGWLGLLTLAVILVTALVMTVLGLVGVNGGGRLGFGEAFWQSMLRVVDAGTFAGDSSWPTRLLGLGITLAGIFLAGSLIGLIANMVDQRVERLRKGRSAVLESGHTLILGWSDRVPVIVGELVLANESERRGVVVVLADRDKSSMEDALRDGVPDLRTTRLVCRSGSGDVPGDLELVNAAGARSVIVVGDDDASVVKTLLAVQAVAPCREGTSGEGTGTHVVAEIGDPSVERTVGALFGPRVITVNSDRIVAELTAQACRQRGLAAAFREMLDFDGDEVYFAPFPEVTGHTFAEAQLAFERCALMGRLTADGVVELNPPADTVLADGDELIGIASDDSTFTFDGFGPAPEVRVRPQVEEAPDPHRIVVVGWSPLGPRVLRELDEFVVPGSVIHVVADPEQVDVDAIGPSVTARNASLEIDAFTGGPEEIAARAAGRDLDEVIVLGYRDRLDADDGDARTLLTLMAFNQVIAGRDLPGVRVVAELLDQRHVPLALATGADDFIVSDELTSLLVAQLSERFELHQVFQELFDRDGCTIEMRPVSAYGAQGLGSFAEMVVAAARQNHTALGYRRSVSGEVVVNPPKSAPLQLDPDDALLVLRH